MIINNKFPFHQTGQRKKRAAPPPPIARPLPSAISAQGLERIVDSDESLTSDMDLSKPSSDIDASASKASSDIVCSSHIRGPIAEQPEDVAAVEPARVGKRGKLDTAQSSSFSSEDSMDENSGSAFLGRFVTPLTSSCREAKESVDSETVRPVQKSNGVAVRVQSSSSQDEFDRRKGSVRQSKKILVKVPTIANLNLNLESECGILESRYSPTRSHMGNYLCEERCKLRRHLAHSLSFQANDSALRPRNKRVTNDRFSAGRFKQWHSNRFDISRIPKLGDLSLIRCHEEAITSSQDFDSMDLEESLEENLSPPPLSNLHIFAISTKPEDIALAPMEESIPGDIDKLPSLPIIDHSERKIDFEKKLSILEPPPPGLVSREESNENWNRFLLQLNSILESRVGEFV